jgi:hypothetical protein
VHYVQLDERKKKGFVPPSALHEWITVCIIRFRLSRHRSQRGVESLTARHGDAMIESLTARHDQLKLDLSRSTIICH